MLDSDDIKKIGVEVGEVIEHNITPAIDDLRTEMRGEFKVIKADISSIKTQMVTKPYLDDKLADLEGGGYRTTA